MTEFHILGATTLRREDGDFDHSFLAGPKRLALLTYLTLARGYQRRDKLVTLFWPERGQKSARNALSNMLYQIREVMGKDAILGRGSEEICTNGDKVWCDALAFEKALDEGEERKALDLYRGDLLPGFHITDASNEFMSWLDSERQHLRQRAAEAAWVLAKQARHNQNISSARLWAKKATTYTDFSEEAYLRLITFLHQMGDRSEVLKTYEEFTTRMREEWEMEPSPELHALVDTIRESDPKQSLKLNTGMQKAESKASIAVLPFEIVGTQTTSAFASGLHGDVLTNLSNIRDIKVISRTSVRKFANSQQTVKEIGRELNADWLLEGDVQENSERVQLNVRLINAKTDSQLWSQDYRRKLTAGNLFNIQGEITKEIAEALKAEFTPKEKQRVERRPTENLDAYRLYMQGLSLVEQRTEKGTRRALEYFDQAIEHDPAFSLALTGRAQALLALYGYGFEISEEILTEAEKTIHQVLDQDKELAEAHAALGVLHSERHRGPEAVQGLKRAIELRPGYADAHNKLSWVYQLIGDKNEALKSAKKAVDLDPFSPEAVINLSFSYLANGELEKALMQARHVCKLQPEWTSGPFYTGLILYHQERFNEAKSHLQNLDVPWAGEGPRLVLALCKIATGDNEAARSHLAYFKGTEDYFPAGLVQAALGETEQALDALEKVEHWGAWPTHAMYYLFPEIIGKLKKYPRFQNVFNEMVQSWGMEPKAFAAPVSKQNRTVRSIAVLPFAALSSNEHNIFADGVHDDLLARLSNIAGLEVTSRTSVMRYKATGESLKTISRQLSVNWIVEGSVQQIQNYIHVRVHLVNAKTDRQFWGEDYQKELSADNLFLIQGEIAKQITRSLQVTLSPEEEQRIHRKPTDNLDAYRLYTQGRRYLNQRTEAAMHHALDCFRQAIEQDANYVLAWTGIADTLSLFRFYGYEYPENTYDHRKAVEYALEIDPNSGEAHVSMGILYSFHTRGPEALSELRQAAALTPSYAEVWIWLGWVLLCLGRPEEAVEPARQSVKLNPLAPAFRVYLAEIYLANGRLELALQEARRAREIQPEYGLTHFMEGLVYYHINQLEKAVSSLQQALALVPPYGTPTQDEIRALLAVTHFSAGNMDEVNVLSDQVDEPFSAGVIHAATGDEKKAFDCFDQVETWNSFSNEHLRYFLSDLLGPLRGHRRYHELIKAINKSWGLNADGSIPS